ncbi:MAG: polysaccharide biosynthesis/export family protein [Bryobacter sp.]|nr:polysaccharide biosynthesis/export family protein [Bryobacter sp.]
MPKTLMVMIVRILLFLPVILLGQVPPANYNGPATAPYLANLPSQKIGPDDLLQINVYGAPELSRTVRVNQEGFIRLPMLKTPIRAASLLPSDLEGEIAAALSKDQILVSPVVTVTVAEYISRPISVMGAVRTPTTFQAFGHVTLLDALSRSGGLTADSGSEILLSRSQPDADGKPTTLTQRIPVRKLIDEADPELNYVLRGGEEIRVPEAPKIYVVGNVKRPGAFPLKDANDTSVLKLLAMSEGLLPYALKEAFIYRREANGSSRNEIAIPLERIMSRKAPDVQLYADDVLYIPDNKNRRLAMSVVDRIATFGAGTASGMLVWRR